LVARRSTEEISKMPMHNSDLIATFLAEQRPAIIGLVEQAFAEAAGHYTIMTPGERRRQAEHDGDEFIADLLRGGVDWEAIRTLVRTAPDPAIPSDMLLMSGILERLFTAFVDQELAAEPDVAQELARRTTSLIACRQINLTAAQIDSMLYEIAPPAGAETPAHLAA
jgi:hypothetical protein